jgi:hypothetical protein
VPVRVATVESIAIVTAVEPLKLVPCKPVPIVKAAVVLAVIVPEAPRATETPLNVVDELTSDEFPMFVSVLSGPLIVLPVNVWIPVNVATVLSMLMVLAVDPSNVDPEFSWRPVPAVSAAVVLAVIVPDPPSATLTPLYVTELLVREALPMSVKVFNAPERVLPVNVAGMSALTNSLNVVGAGEPDVGPAYT